MKKPTATFKKGQAIKIRKEWQDAGDDKIAFTCIEDEDGGRVKIMALLGFSLNPVQVVETRMIESA